MKPGPKAKTPAEKRARGTFQPSRDAGAVTIIEATAMPIRPTWLTSEGEEIWLDDVGRVQPGKLITEADSSAFGNYCNLQGMIVKCWRAGEAPPITAIAEVRKQQELFGIAGSKSRLIAKGGAAQPAGNPFLRNGARS